jgi:hypothetical protein
MPSSKKGEKMKRKLAKWVTWYMVVVMCLIGITPRLYAGLAPSDVISLSPSDRSSDLQKIQKVLESKMIRERLKQMGFSEEGIQNRLRQLTDDQIHQFALKVDELNVGGDGGAVVIIVLLVLILAALIIYVTGHRIVIQ